jgi:O-antigen/teichoic acid export membrane protein
MNHDRGPIPRFRNRLYSLAGTGLMSLASQGINSSNNFVSGIIMGRLCPKEEYGLYALGLSLVLLITDFQSTLISTPYIVYSPRLQSHDRRRYAGSTFIHQIAFSAITAFLLLCGLGAVYAGMAPQGFTRVLEVLAAVIVFIMLKDFIRQMCFASLNVKAALFVDSMAALIQIGCLTLLAYSGALSADRTFLVVGISCGLTSAGWLFANRGLFVVELKQVLPDLRQKWSLVKWVTASQILWILAMSLYPLLLATFQGVQANGIWAACQSVIMIGNLIGVAAQNLLGPKLVHVLAQRGVSEMRSMIFKSTVVMFVIMSMLCILFVVFGNSLVVLFYGRKYDGYGLVVSILALNLAVSSMTYPFSRGLFALERADLDFMVNLAVVVTLLLGVWLVRTFGLPGAALGLLAANALSVLLRGIAFNRVSLAGAAVTAA